MYHHVINATGYSRDSKFSYVNDLVERPAHVAQWSPCAVERDASLERACYK